MRIKKAQGQIAIFVVLVFQVLFILFAMTINIALVVHDKINFQNSLDLAAYYGAKQQAEVLNAMAHINYQMRQNWKLLAWRYRILGTLTQNRGDCTDESCVNQTPGTFWCPQNRNNNTNCRDNTSEICRFAQTRHQRNRSYGDNYCDRYYFVCISQDAWKRGLSYSEQNLCQTAEAPPMQIQPLTVVAPFVPAALVAARATRELQRRLELSCPEEGALNALMVQFFLTHFRLDQKDRTMMMKTIFEKTLREGNDLDGNSIFEGAKKVFINNLTSANKKNVQEQGIENFGLQEFNSFKGKSFDEIFQPLKVLPLLQYLDFDRSSCQGKIVNNLVSEFVTGGVPNFTPTSIKNKLARHTLKEFIDGRPHQLFEFNHGTNYTFGLSSDLSSVSLKLGFYKEPDQILYYGLKGNFKYLSRNQIFSLNINPIDFKASAFAKPFGGRFGPAPDKSDPLIAIHHPSARLKISVGGNDELSLNPAVLQPNYSRWPGDKWGLIDRTLHDPSDRDNSDPSNFLKKVRRHFPAGVYTMEAFFHLIFSEGPNDPLARYWQGGSNPSPRRPNYFLRMLELLAVYPDLYDIYHYSIQGNYMQTYFKRICDNLLEKPCDGTTIDNIGNAGEIPAFIRGDFGWPDHDHYIPKNKSAVEVELSVAAAFLKDRGFDINTEGWTGERYSDEVDPQNQVGSNNITLGNWDVREIFKANNFYPWLARDLPHHLLSSWVPERKLNYADYNLERRGGNATADYFLECNKRSLEGMQVPSSCVVGGRSGYSVKLISCDVVKEFSDQPDNIEDFCN